MREKMKRRWIGSSNIAAASLALVLCACSQPAAQTEASNQDGTAPLSEMFAQQNLCDPVWRRIYTQWMDNGGGIKDSLGKTRDQVTSDRKSTLARIIRDVWNSPKDPRMKPEQLWKWPISPAVSRKVGLLFSEASRPYVPKQCAIPIWLPAIIWDDLRFVNGNPMKFRMPSEAPVGVDWDSSNAPYWVIDWLLVDLPSSERSRVSGGQKFL